MGILESILKNAAGKVALEALVAVGERVNNASEEAIKNNALASPFPLHLRCRNSRETKKTIASEKEWYEYSFINDFDKEQYIATTDRKGKKLSITIYDTKGKKRKKLAYVEESFGEKRNIVRYIKDDSPSNTFSVLLPDGTEGFIIFPKKAKHIISVPIMGWKLFSVGDIKNPLRKMMDRNDECICEIKGWLNGFASKAFTLNYASEDDAPLLLAICSLMYAIEDYDYKNKKKS